MSNFLLDIATMVLIMMVFIPQFQLLSNFNYIFLGVEIIWLTVAILKKPRFFLGENSYFIQSFLLCIITILIPIFFDIQTIANRYSTFTAIPLFYWIYSYNAIYRGLKSNLRIVFFSLIPIAYTSFQTIEELIINPFAARLVKTDGDVSRELWSKGVSGYSLIYATVIIVLILIPILIERKKLKVSTLSSICLFFVILLFSVLIGLSNYFTALIVVISGLLLYLSLYFSKKLFILLVLPLSLTYFIAQKEINRTAIESLMILAPQEGRTYQRLEEIRNSLVNNIEVKDFDSRLESRNASLQLFAEYPVGGYTMASASNTFDLNRVGQHSYILDTYALFGFFIGTFTFWIMWLPYKYRIVRKYNYRLRVFALIIGISFMLIIVNNNLTPSIGYAAFFVFATVFDYLKVKIHV